MGLLYVDEAGNSGLQDTSQPNFLYGGIYINNRQWKDTHNQMMILLEEKKRLITSRVGNITFNAEKLDNIQKQLSFFKELHFHAKEIIRGTSLWGKLDEDERFVTLSQIVDICKKNEIKIYIGILNKQHFINNMSLTGKEYDLMDYKLLIPYYFNELEKELIDEYVLVRAQGDIHESRLISEALFNTNKFFPDEFIIEAKKSLMLQIADTILWIIQAYKKIDLSKTTFKSKEQKVIELYKKLVSLDDLFTLYDHRPIYL